MMLETIREFGLEQLAATGEETSVRRRHLGWFADFTERCQPGVFGPEGPAWVDRLAAELDNLRAAMGWSVSDPSVVSARAGLRSPKPRTSSGSIATTSPRASTGSS